jgi:hypothetical protein
VPLAAAEAAAAAADGLSGMCWSAARPFAAGAPVTAVSCTAALAAWLAGPTAGSGFRVGGGSSLAGAGGAWFVGNTAGADDVLVGTGTASGGGDGAKAPAIALPRWSSFGVAGVGARVSIALRFLERASALHLHLKQAHRHICAGSGPRLRRDSTSRSHRGRGLPHLSLDSRKSAPGLRAHIWAPGRARRARACRGTGPAEHLAGHHRAHSEQPEAHVRLQRRKAAAAAAAVDLPEESVAVRDDRPFRRLSSAPLCWVTGIIR